jgi:hypothetical protein
LFGKRSCLTELAGQKKNESAREQKGGSGGESCAWFVPVKWTHTVPEKEAVREVGFFGNQNSVTKPKSEKWEHTVRTLKSRWGVS